MLLLTIIAQLGAAQTKPADSVYATDALRSMVQAAATANREAPSALNAYRAHLETEIGLIIVDTLGRENTGQLEQLGSTATWSRDSGYDAHVIGYRTQSAGGFPIGVAAAIKGWSLPMLYGERLLIGVEGTRDSGAVLTRRGMKGDTLIAVHPFADDRDQYYRYSGGDTIATLTTATRRIPLVRIRVIPNLAVDAAFAAFDGEIDIDADRHAIVRMRGQFVVNREPTPPLGIRLMLKATGTVGIVFAEYVNAEYDDRYWLPATQRIEFQARIALAGGMRSIVRITSRFSSFAIDDTTQTAGDTPRAAYNRRRVTFAPSDTLSAFDGWMTNIGTATSSVAADDFDDVAPPAWKGLGPPNFTLYPSAPDRIAHYNRIEGLFTGAEASLEMRGVAPGIVGRVHGGWAWAEQTARGGISVMDVGKTSRSEIQADRSLATTGGFQNDRLDGSTSIPAFLASIEEEDYVDRWSAGVSHTSMLGSMQHAFTTINLGVARDVDVQESLQHGPILTGVKFRPNRHAATGDYGIGSIDYEFHPSISGDFLEPGIGSTMHVEAAAGQLSWVRTVATLSAREFMGPVTMSARLRGGAVFGAAPPPQTLFELGGSGGLDGYTYKEFAGDRAATFRASALYGFPIFRAPHRFRKWILIPGLSPGLGMAINGAWTQLSDSAARAALLARGDGTVPLSIATGSPRATVSFGLTFFSHSISIGVARPIDQSGRWRWVLGAGQ